MTPRKCSMEIKWNFLFLQKIWKLIMTAIIIKVKIWSQSRMKIKESAEKKKKHTKSDRMWKNHQNKIIRQQFFMAFIYEASVLMLFFFFIFSILLCIFVSYESFIVPVGMNRISHATFFFSLFPFLFGSTPRPLFDAHQRETKRYLSSWSVSVSQTNGFSLERWRHRTDFFFVFFFPRWMCVCILCVNVSLCDWKISSGDAHLQHDFAQLFIYFLERTNFRWLTFL